MKLALTLGYSGAQMSLDMEKVLEVERLGFDSVWSAEPLDLEDPLHVERHLRAGVAEGEREFHGSPLHRRHA